MAVPSPNRCRIPWSWNRTIKRRPLKNPYCSMAVSAEHRADYLKPFISIYWCLHRNDKFSDRTLNSYLSVKCASNILLLMFDFIMQQTWVFYEIPHFYVDMFKADMFAAMSFIWCTFYLKICYFVKHCLLSLVY